MSDRTIELISSLDPRGRAAAVWLIATLRQAGLPAIVTSARRSAAHQRRLIAAGATTAVRSRHLIGRALDIGFAGVPAAQTPADWYRLAGELWESLGGRWGGRFQLRDPIHLDW